MTLLSVLICAHFTVSYLTITQPMVPFHGYNELRPHGSPFDYRMLPAIVWKCAVWVLHPLAVNYPRLHLPSLNPPFTSNESWFVALITFLSLFGSILVGRRLLVRIDPSPPFEWLALCLPWCAYFDLVLVLNRNLYYPYDLSALFFFMLLVFLAYCDRPVLFGLTLIPAMLNKETAAIAILIYLGLRWNRANLWRLLAVCSGFSIVVIAIRWSQSLWIRSQCGTCGAMSEVHTAYNLRQLANPLFWFSALSVFGFLWVALVPVWRFVPRRVQVTAATVAFLWTAAMIRAGILRELRIFSELSALFLLTFALGVHGWWGKTGAAIVRADGRTEPA